MLVNSTKVAVELWQDGGQSQQVCAFKSINFRLILVSGCEAESQVATLWVPLEG